MATSIGTEETRRLLDEGAQLVEVLPPSQFDEEHLPGARNIPLAELDRDRVRDLDRGRPLVVYCFDFQCDMSPRAARRFEQLGFTDVYDYAPGKAAWAAAGL